MQLSAGAGGSPFAPMFTSSPAPSWVWAPVDHRAVLQRSLARAACVLDLAEPSLPPPGQPRQQPGAADAAAAGSGSHGVGALLSAAVHELEQLARTAHSGSNCKLLPSTRLRVGKAAAVTLLQLLELRLEEGGEQLLQAAWEAVVGAGKGGGEGGARPAPALLSALLHGGRDSSGSSCLLLQCSPPPTLAPPMLCKRATAAGVLAQEQQEQQLLQEGQGAEVRIMHFTCSRRVAQGVGCTAVHACEHLAPSTARTHTPSVSSLCRAACNLQLQPPPVAQPSSGPSQRQTQPYHLHLHLRRHQPTCCLR